MGRDGSVSVVGVYSHVRLFAFMVGVCLLVGSCSSTPAESTKTSMVDDAICGPPPANFAEVPEPVQAQSVRQQELREELLQEWRDQLAVPLDALEAWCLRVIP